MNETQEQLTPCDSPRCSFGQVFGSYGFLNYCARCGGSGYLGADPLRDDWTATPTLARAGLRKAVGQ